MAHCAETVMAVTVYINYRDPSGTVMVYNPLNYLNNKTLRYTLGSSPNKNLTVPSFFPNPSAGPFSPTPNSNSLSPLSLYPDEPSLS